MYKVLRGQNLEQRPNAKVWKPGKSTANLGMGNHCENSLIYVY